MPPAGNVVLIGMPGSGKSTVGVLLAKHLGLGFLDTDILIQTRSGKTLQELIAANGLPGFCTLEARAILSLNSRKHVIATGGSVVYDPRAVDHLRAMGILVFLDVPLAVLERRLGDLTSRGVVLAPGASFPSLFRERRPLYEGFKDLAVRCGDSTPEQVCLAVAGALDRGIRGSRG
jgi:shikimate kinase